jgi:hypothetical protein
LRNASPTDGGFLIALIALAGCGSSGQSSIEQDTAVATEDVAMVAETGPTPQTALTLETGVDQAALAAAVTPQVIEIIRATQPSADADTIQLARPWGEFELHKGPRLIFLGYWRMLATIGGDYFAVVDVVRDGDSYRMKSIGSAQFVPTMVEREKIPAVSSALDRGRAGFFRCAGNDGDSLLAYETEAIAEAGQAEIRVQPLFADSRFRGIDAGADGIAEMSLADFEPMLPAE